MRTVEQFISPLIESQFPQFYREQGPLFILFVEEYFKWMESNDPEFASYQDTSADGNPNYHIRKLLQYRDIDTTIDGFLTFFKQKYSKFLETSLDVSQRKLIKASQDLYTSKGSTRSLDLLFNLLYGTKIEIYTPGDDVLRPSDGTWVIPKYLELSQSSRNSTFPGKQITGSTSGATAFVEYIITRNINGKKIDIAFLSSLVGNFITGESVADNPLVEGAPKVLGSLSTLEVTLPGELFEQGEIVKIVSSSGTEGLARVAEIDSVTGVVRFQIIKGGWGYSNTASVIISDKVIGITNTFNSNAQVNSFVRFEIVSQNLFSFSLTNVTGQLVPDAIFHNGDIIDRSNSVAVSVSQTIDTVANTANVILNQTSANVFSNTILYARNRALISTYDNVTFEIGDQLVQSNGTTNSTIGTVSSVTNTIMIEVDSTSIGANGIHVGTFIEQSNTNASGIISLIPRENNFTFTNVTHISVVSANGTFNNTDTITAYANNSKTTTLVSFDPQQIFTGKQYLLLNTNFLTETRWSFGNTAIKIGSPTINSTVLIASDIGGLAVACTNLTATANLIGSNTTAIGIIDANNTFYGLGRTQIVGLTSNTSANTTRVFTGSGASFSIGSLENVETVRVSPILINSNNNGPSNNSIKFSDMLINGITSTFNTLSGVFIISAGSGYDNTNIVLFSGGNTGAGSFEAGNGTIITNSSGGIITVTLSANTGNGIVTLPTASIVNSTGGNTGTGSSANLLPISSLGFPKLPIGDIESPLIDLLTYETKVIGTIASLTSINPGENYNITPFVTVIDPQISSYGQKDILLEIISISGPGFIINELVEQTSNSIGIQISSNNFSGNTSLSYEEGEAVFSTDGINNTAFGIISSTTLDGSSNTYTTILTSNTGLWQNTISTNLLTVSSNNNFNPGNLLTQGSANGILVTSNSTTLVVKNVQGTFQVNATPVTSNSSPTPGSQTITNTTNTSIFTMNGLTSKGVTNINNTQSVTTSAIASGKVIAFTGNNNLSLARTSLFTNFLPGLPILGRTGGTTANVVGVSPLEDSSFVGDNAIVSANVISSEGAIKSLEVVSSGYGYVDDEQATVVSLDNSRAAGAKVQLVRQGIGEGYYSSTKGFPDDNRFLFDGEFYQNYSYEIRSSIPLDKYSDILKETLHIAGKKFFGRVVIDTENTLITSSNLSITIT
jgi:hypothetical protein